MVSHNNFLGGLAFDSSGQLFGSQCCRSVDLVLIDKVTGELFQLGAGSISISDLAFDLGLSGFPNDI